MRSVHDDPAASTPDHVPSSDPATEPEAATEPETAIEPDPATQPGSATERDQPLPAEPPQPDLSPQPERASRRTIVALAAVAVVIAFAAGIGVGRSTAPAGEAPSSPEAAASPGAEASASPAASGIAGLPREGNRLGRPDAKVVVTYWADYQCPFCAKFAQEVIPQLESRLADGTVALVHRDFAFLGPESLDAAVAVRCAEREGKYWQMHDAVYASQVGENQGAFARARLAQIAAGVGLDATAFATCMDEREPLVSVLDDTAAGTRAGISSTPTVDVNGNRFPGASDLPAMLAAIDAAAAGASPAPTPTAPPTRDPWTDIATTGREAGDPAAPVTVELWMDYQSADGAVVAKTLGPELRTRITQGDVRVVQRDLAVLGDESVLAAATVRCVADQGGPAWFVHDILATSGRGAGAGLYTPTSLLWLGAKLGLDVDALNRCLEDPATAEAVKSDTADGTAAGLTTPPAVLVRRGGEEVGRFSGTLDVPAIVAAIDAGG